MASFILFIARDNKTREGQRKAGGGQRKIGRLTERLIWKPKKRETYEQRLKQLQAESKREGEIYRDRREGDKEKETNVDSKRG